MKLSLSNRLTDFIINYFTVSGQLVPQAEAEKSIRDGVSFKGPNILILILAILIASLGLNTNSTAVIIGAMLISPLMGPIIGIGLAVGIHDFNLLTRCMRNLLMAALFSMLASTLYFLISPVNEQHSELLARTSPTIYDVLIGFFGGGAGIIALGSTSKGNVIPGVAIATALMPPLCTAGYGLATWQLRYFFGASYLFIINSIYIAFATFIGVKLMNYHGVDVTDNARAKKVRKIVYTLAVLTMMPSIYLTYNMLKENKFAMKAASFISHECVFPSTQVLSKNVYTSNGQRYIDITLIGKVLPADSLKLALASRLKFYGLEGTKLEIIQGDAATAPISGDNSSVRDIYQLAQATITRQQSTIDSLREKIHDESKALTLGVEVTPEIKVLFPQISEIAISRSIFSKVISDGEKKDTVNMALVSFSSKMTEAQRQKLSEYLEARLSTPDIHIVDVPQSIVKNVQKKK